MICLRVAYDRYSGSTASADPALEGTLARLAPFSFALEIRDAHA